jgi:hypothetical protein
VYSTYKLSCSKIIRVPERLFPIESDRLKIPELTVSDIYVPTTLAMIVIIALRDFDAGTAGLASVGTACRPEKNSGFVTFLNYNQ